MNRALAQRVNPVTGRTEGRAIASCLRGCRLARTLLLLTVVLPGCGDDAPTRAHPGAPWPGLSEADLRAFPAGRDLFHREFTPREGLGPNFNKEQQQDLLGFLRSL